MKCPSCQQDMVQSSIGWLCINCGHKEAPAPSPKGEIIHGTAVPESSNPPANIIMPEPPSPAPSEPPESPAPAAAVPEITPPPAPMAPPTASSAPMPAAPSEQPNTPPPPPPAPSAAPFVGMPVPPVTNASAVPFTTPIGPGVEMQNGLPVVKPKRHVKRFVFGSLALLSGLLVLGYLFILAPKTALALYAYRAGTAKTAVYNVNYENSGGDAASGSFSVTAAGAYDIKDYNNPASTTAITGTYDFGSLAGTAAKGKVAADLRYLDKVLYFKIGGDLATSADSLLGLKLTDQWYYYDLTDVLKTTEADACSKKLKDNDIVKQALSNLPVNKTSLKGIVIMDGEARLHFYGEYDNTQLKAAIDKFIAKLPAECKTDQASITSTENDITSTLKDVKLTYNLWRGFGGDKLELTMTVKDQKGSSQLTVETSHYNRTLVVAKPAGAKDITAVLNDTSSGTSSYDTTGTTVSSGSASLDARDVQRKTDLRVIQMGLEEYFVANNAYPATLAQLTTGSSPYLKTIPKDPKNVNPYVYTYLPSSGNSVFVLTACLENSKDNGTNTLAPTGACKTRIFQLENLN